MAHLYPGFMKGFSFVQLLMNYLFHMLIIASLKAFNTDCPTVLKKCFTNLYYFISRVYENVYPPFHLLFYR